MKIIRYATIWAILISSCLLVGVSADTSEAGLKTELAAGNIRIAELEEKLKQLEEELRSTKRMSKMELQELLNDKCGEYEGVICRAIISGNEDEIRLKVEIDLSRDKTSWNRLNINKRKEMLKRICDLISFEYEHAKIKGYVKDISTSKKLLTFYNTNEGAVEIRTYRNYSVISTLEDRFNNEYDSYFNGIHFTYALNGNDSRLQYTIYIQKNRFEEQWNNKKEPTLKNFMKKLCSEINKEFSGCNITGVIYDTDGSRQLAKCEQNSDGAFSFSMEP